MSGNGPPPKLNCELAVAPACSSPTVQLISTLQVPAFPPPGPAAPHSSITCATLLRLNESRNRNLQNLHRPQPTSSKGPYLTHHSLHLVAVLVLLTCPLKRSSRRCPCFEFASLCVLSLLIFLFCQPSFFPLSSNAICPRSIAYRRPFSVYQKNNGRPVCLNYTIHRHSSPVQSFYSGTLALLNPLATAQRYQATIYSSSH